MTGRQTYIHTRVRTLTRKYREIEIRKVTDDTER